MAGKFDLKVHIRDSKTGQITRKNPYQLKVEQGRIMYVRNGVRYHADGSQYNPEEKEVLPKGPEELKVDLLNQLQKAKEEAAKVQADKVFLAKEREDLEKMKAELAALKAAAQKPVESVVKPVEAKPAVEAKGVK